MDEAMRRRDRQITSDQTVDLILNRCKVCRIGLVDGQEPYVLPMNFGYERIRSGLIFYLHTAQQGRKLDILARNNHVCIELDCDHQLTGQGDLACRYSFGYTSFIGRARAEQIELPEQKQRALALIMKHQTGRDNFSFDPKILEKTAVLRLECLGYTVKANPAER